MRKGSEITPEVIPKPENITKMARKINQKEIKKRTNCDVGHRSAPRMVKASTKIWIFEALWLQLTGFGLNFGTHQAPWAPEIWHFGAKVHQKM